MLALDQELWARRPLTAAGERSETEDDNSSRGVVQQGCPYDFFRFDLPLEPDLSSAFVLDRSATLLVAGREQ